MGQPEISRPDLSKKLSAAHVVGHIVQLLYPKNHTDFQPRIMSYTFNGPHLDLDHFITDGEMDACTHPYTAG